VFTRNDLWAQLFRNQIGEAMPKTASTQPLRALPATFTYAQARHAGLSKHTLYRLREGGRGRGNQSRPVPASRRRARRHRPHCDRCQSAPGHSVSGDLARHGLSDAILV